MDYVPLCQPWPTSCVNWNGVDPAVTGTAVQAASEWLWALSGRQFGSCEVQLRPCAESCDIGNGWWWNGGTWPAAPLGPGFILAACGCGVSRCSCGDVSELNLKHPVQSITKVIVDEDELAEGTDWVLYDGFRLVRVGGRWPRCQDWTIPVSGIGAWSVFAVYGFPVPTLGEMAMGEAAREFGLACTPDAQCALPSRVTSVVRNGITQSFATLTDLYEAGATGLPVTDRFIDAVNPGRIRDRVAIWNPDDYDTPRRPGGATW